jgi:glutamine synthetase
MKCRKCKCWQEMCERLEKRAALFDECDALIAAVEGLVAKVDGVKAPVSEWRADGRRLKDTAEWALLYCAWSDLNRKAKKP